MATTPPVPPPPPFDPTNRNDPRYDPRLDPSMDPRWQRDQARAWQRAQKEQQRAWRDQRKYASRMERDVVRDRVRAASYQRDQARAFQRGRRAPSFVGPILLIGIAVVILLVHDGRIALPSLLAWYSRWWPVLLIGVGLLRLAEWAIDRATHKPGTAPVRYSVGGGTVVLIVLLAFFGFAAEKGIRHDHNGDWNFGWNGDDVHELFGSKHEEDSPAITQSIAPNASLQINNPHGDVTVTGTSDDGLLHLSVHKEVFTSSDSSTGDRLSGLTPQFTGNPDSLTLQVRNGDSSDSADLVLLVPVGVRVTINADHGDVKATNLRAPLYITSNRGDVTASAITGDVTAHMNSRHSSLDAHSIQGALQVMGTGDEMNISDVAGSVHVAANFFGSGRMQHVGGSVDYRSDRTTLSMARLNGEITFDGDEWQASDAAGPFALHTRGREITLNRITGDVNVTNSHGRVDLTAVPPSGNVSIDNHEGDVRVWMPQAAHFSFSADTSDGTINSSFPGVSGTSGPSARGVLTQAVNGGGSPVRITTTHGNIELDRNNEVAAPPPLPPMHLGFTDTPPGVPSAPKPPTAPAAPKIPGKPKAPKAAPEPTPPPATVAPQP